MNHRSPPTVQNQGSLLLSVLAALLMLIVPVSARDGGETLHAHALLQLLADGADGRLDHHYPEGVDPPGSQVARSAGSSVAMTLTMDPVPRGAELSRARGHKVLANGSLAAPQRTATTTDEAPSLLPLSAAAMAALMAALMVIVLPVPLGPKDVGRLFYRDRTMTGRFPALDPPPPRGLLLTT